MAEAPAPEPASPPGELAPPVAEPAPDAGEGAPAALATPEPAPAEPTPPPASVPAPDEHIVAEGGAAGERDAAEPRGEGAASGQELDRAPAVSADGDQEVELLEDDFFEPEIIQVERVSGDEEDDFADPPPPPRPPRKVAEASIDLSQGASVLLDDELGAVLIDDVDDLVAQLRRTAVRAQQPRDGAPQPLPALAAPGGEAWGPVGASAGDRERLRRQWDVPAAAATHDARDAVPGAIAPFSAPRVPPPHLVPSSRAATRPASASGGVGVALGPVGVGVPGERVTTPFAGSDSAARVRDRIVAATQREASLRAEAELHAYDMHVLEHERGALEAESRALREAVQSLRGELAAVSAALDEERSHPAYGRALALEAEVRGLRQAVEGQREDLAAMAREVEAERAAGRELRNRLAAERERVALLQSVLQQALAERVAEREAAQQQAAAVWTLQEQVASLSAALTQAEHDHRMLARQGAARPDSAPIAANGRSLADQRLRSIEATLRAMSAVAEVRGGWPPGQGGEESHAKGRPPSGRAQAASRAALERAETPTALSDRQRAAIARRHPGADPALLEPAGIPGYAFHPDFGIVPIVGDGPDRGRGGERMPPPQPPPPQPQPVSQPPAPLHVHIHSGAGPRGAGLESGEGGEARGAGQARDGGGGARGGPAAWGGAPDDWDRRNRGGQGNARGNGVVPGMGMGPGLGPGTDTWGTPGMGRDRQVASGPLEPPGPSFGIAGEGARPSAGVAAGERAPPWPGVSAAQTPGWAQGDGGGGLVRKRQRRGTEDVSVPPEKVAAGALAQARQAYVEEVARIKDLRMREAMEQAGRA